MNIRCAHCKKTHGSVDVVRRCSQGLVFDCTWLVNHGYDEDGGLIALDCGAASWETPRGWECEAGHAHVTAEVRQAEGWDYAADEDEATLLRKYGVDAVAMDGSSI